MIGMGTQPSHRMNWLPRWNRESRLQHHNKEKGESTTNYNITIAISIRDLCVSCTTPILSKTTRDIRAFGDTVPPSPGHSASGCWVFLLLERSYVSHFIYIVCRIVKCTTSHPDRVPAHRRGFKASVQGGVFLLGIRKTSKCGAHK